MKLTSKMNSKCVHKVLTKINNAETKQHKNFLLTKWKLKMRKTTPRLPNSGYPLFRRQDSNTHIPMM